MKRYHFSIAGEAGQLGLVGALFAETDHQAIAMLDEVLAASDGVTIVDSFRGREPDPGDVDEPKISYVSVATNGLRASITMFDEMECNGEEDEPDVSASLADGGAAEHATGALAGREISQRYSFLERSTTIEHERREWELIVEGRPSEWTMYELSPASRFYARGAFGFVDGNQELQFPTIEAAQTALARAWEAANGHRRK